MFTVKIENIISDNAADISEDKLRDLQTEAAKEELVQPSLKLSSLNGLKTRKDEVPVVAGKYWSY